MNRYVAVCLQNKSNPSEFNSREYTYIDGVGLMMDDLVVAPTANGNCIAKVTRVGVPEDEIDSRILPVLKTIEALHPDEKGGEENV